MKIKLDWRSYFEGFCELHGKPVDYKGRLLFPDGWTYSRTEHQGPEYPPPTDKRHLQELKRDYWQARMDKSELDLKDAERLLGTLTGQQQMRSAPLKTGVRVFDEESGRYRRGVSDVSLPSLREEVESMREEVQECQRQLKTVGRSIPAKSC